MKIEKLIIYGFGKHENVTVDLGSGMNVLYGVNEAGKTTIQQFILHILFGFPQKNSASLRYEPKSGGKYGGQVHLFDETYGKCIVERVRGKSAGDVIVHFEDGKKGVEADLTILLRQYDRASFESIFSFSLLQLQGFEKMDEDELSRTLLASGTTGVDSLLQLEKRMEKEMGELFKKSGRNPEMNVKMAELRELEIELKEEQGKATAYAPSIERIQEINQRLAELRGQEKMLQNDSQQLTLVRQLLPLHQKKQTLESRLAQLSNIEFPANGIGRFESLTGKITETEAAKRRMEKELSEMGSRMPEQFGAERITKIEVLIATESEWHGWHTVSKATEDELRQLMGKKGRLLDRLGIKEKEAEQFLLQRDVSIQKEEEMHGLIRRRDDYDQQIKFTEYQFRQLENDLIDMEKKIESAEQVAPSAKDQEDVRKWPEIRQQLAEAKAYVALGGRPSLQNSLLVPAILFLLALACILFGLIQQEWLVVVVGVIIGAVGVFLYSKKGARSTDDSYLHEMENIIATHDGKEQQMADFTERNDSYNREKERLQEAFKTVERQYSQTEAKLDGLHDKRRQLEMGLVDFLRQYGFEGMPLSGVIPELFRMIREVQEVSRNREEALLKRQTAQDAINKRIAEAEKVLQKNVPQELIYEMLRREFLQLRKEADTAKSLQGSMERIESNLRENIELSNSLQATIQGLLAEAEAETESEFYSAHDGYQEVVRLTEQLNDVMEQLATHDRLKLPTGVTEEELVSKEEENRLSFLMITEELHNLIAEQAALVHKTERLLTDETAGQKLQLFEMKKAEFAELAKKWSTRKVVAEAIRRTMEELKEKKLPEVLDVAEKLFCELTDGKYTAFNVTETGHFEALSMDGMRYPIAELSQATKEQAYISLRLSLASSVFVSAPLPIMMDDPFVHFDAGRLSSMINVLDKLQQKHQFIYFTCHEMMKEQWADATLLNVSDIGSGQGAMVL
ncbi:ATP-binding protein [Sporosarcina limicola]|uniref:Uncharacterized protein YhaN n=1 Tax=Sporosarcina limicola TaxID=34101 RepID=A0A927R3B9_9BACL|nr:AAA family ATPase [Sporosarcina limicola]MBE1554911.1 uncharacterized protein YhaN [Sporosarcina limicola]